MIITDRQLVRLASWAGVAGPLAFAGTVAGLTWAQWEFMRWLGWHPLRAPTLDWPSGLALGPHGWLMQTTFVGSGVLIAVFARGLQRGVERRDQWLGPLLLGLAGGAMALLVAPTDPTLRGTGRTWHGILHDAAFVLLGVSLFPALLLLGRRFRGLAAWRGHAAYTWGTVALAGPAFALKGAFFYLFLAGIIAWFAVTAVRLGKNHKT